MSKKVYSKNVYAYDFEDIEVFFKYENTVIYSTDKRTRVAKVDGISKAKEIEAVSVCYVEDYDSVNEIARYCRTEILVVQGIVSFFTGIPFTVYQKTSSSSSCLEEIDFIKKQAILIIEGKNYTEELIMLLHKMESEHELIISLLDRWRKAIYLSEESLDANLYHDEAILSYFHIIELFAESCNNEFKSKLKANIDSFLYSYYKDNFYFSENQISQKVNSAKEFTYEMLIGNELALSHKIKYFLKKYNILDLNIDYFIDSLIKIRNTIAHGRITYEKIATWPLPPFFCLARDSYNILGQLQMLTAKMISVYLGINCWDEEWEETKKYLLPPEDVLSSYLKNPSEFVQVTKENISTNNVLNITWGTIFQHFIKNPKRFSLERIGLALGKMFLATEMTEENGADLFNISILLCDHNEEKINLRAISNIKEIINNNWFGWSNIKDAYRFLNYKGIKVTWFKEFLESGEYLNCKLKRKKK